MPPFRADLLQRDAEHRDRRAWYITGGIAAALILIGVLTGVFWRWAFHDLPVLPEDPAALWSARREASITLLDRNGEILDIRGPRYAPPVRADELPPHVIQAFLAIEDRRFFRHHGVDLRATVRAVLANMRAGGSVQGGSTITMQLVKNLLLTPERSIRRKVQEMRLAWALERQLTKTEILELYLNRIYLGAGAYGLEAAARRYFDKSAADLNLAEAAMIAGLPQAPSRLDPLGNLPAARDRAAEVLFAMEAAGFITETQRHAALLEPATPVRTRDENAPSPEIFGYVFDYALQLVQEELPGAPNDLVIQTTIDPELQADAQSAVHALLEAEGEAERAGQAALVSLTPDGAIRAMVGGRDYGDSQFNRAVQARRQPGSSFKPIVFAAAIEAGLSPFTAYTDEPIDLDGWSPRNFGGTYRGRVTMREALRRSINTVAAQIADEIGIDRVVDMGRRLGIESELPELPAVSLGTAEVTLLELAGAYATFANDGVRREPFLILRVTDTRGHTLYEHEDGEGERAIEAEVAQTMTSLLQDVVLAGTGTAARMGERPVAGKTGTSQSFRDAWFVGYTADFVTGVWVGNDDDTPTADVTGGSLPARIWNRYMTSASEGLPVRPLNAPPPRERTEREERQIAYYSSLSRAFEAEAERIP
ncbi:penicillin-binding protein 1A [Hyphobacterium sp. SN044]|uniref:transglycosylase domain-containing protein n=1 Tax=Hyphobacterium sp. SN044 TaxID=2912575 RepID=UPI001F47EB2F|nr:penicillin-binding protein 1A [Hyphobacterium sp. SN044]MCF8879252.1 penicillin-binding protein 1A [Hyphobacterium sp. SN044]